MGLTIIETRATALNPPLTRTGAIDARVYGIDHPKGIAQVVEAIREHAKIVVDKIQFKHLDQQTGFVAVLKGLMAGKTTETHDLETEYADRYRIVNNVTAGLLKQATDAANANFNQKKGYEFDAATAATEVIAQAENAALAQSNYVHTLFSDITSESGSHHYREITFIEEPSP